MPAFLDRTGMRYGMLTVVRRLLGGKGVRWECICDCGNSTVVNSRNFATGNTTSCGCAWQRAVTANMIGRSFGKLTVISSAEPVVFPSGTRARRYTCSCQCGGTITTLGMSLRNGDTISCGCAYSDAGKARMLEPTEKRNRLRASNKRRTARIAAATRPFDKELFYFVRAEARRLAKEREICTGVKHDVDHIVPIASLVVCGLNNEFNIAVIPSSLNRRKKNRFWPGMPEAAACFN